ncbi:MAG: ASCH domain-containing protein, partial [Rhodospirillaceae bacterium]|nr:ASCH domain-containing protein [Rhodospirillaceae bacterium]
MSAAIDAFWRAAQAAHPGLVGPFAVKRIGTSAEICERLLALILSGQKTGTFTLPWLHGRHPDWIPRTGGLMIYIDFSDTPRALIRQKTPEFVRYDQIDASHVACEGPGARDPKVWRDIHWP